MDTILSKLGLNKTKKFLWFLIIFLFGLFVVIAIFRQPQVVVEEIYLPPKFDAVVYRFEGLVTRIVDNKIYVLLDSDDLIGREYLRLAGATDRDLSSPIPVEISSATDFAIRDNLDDKRLSTLGIDTSKLSDEYDGASFYRLKRGSNDKLQIRDFVVVEYETPLMHNSGQAAYRIIIN